MWRRTASEPWPQDPRLDPFRDAVWELSRDGRVAGHLVSSIGPMRSFPGWRERQEWMLYAVVWSDGTVERPNEDYGPQWLTVAELEQGYYDDGDRYAARRLEGEARDRIWWRWSTEI